MDRSCLCPDGQPLPPPSGNAEAQSRGRNEVVAGNLCAAVNRASPTPYFLRKLSSLRQQPPQGVGGIFSRGATRRWLVGCAGAYFLTVASYIHLNPVRAGLLDFEAEGLEAYAWSSYPLCFERAKRPDWLCVDRGLGAFQWLDDRKGFDEFRKVMLKRTLKICSSEHPWELDARWRAIRRVFVVPASGNRVKRINFFLIYTRRLSRV